MLQLKVLSIYLYKCCIAFKGLCLRYHAIYRYSFTQMCRNLISWVKVCCILIYLPKLALQRFIIESCKTREFRGKYSSFHPGQINQHFHEGSKSCWFLMYCVVISNTVIFIFWVIWAAYGSALYVERKKLNKKAELSILFTHSEHFHFSHMNINIMEIIVMFHKVRFMLSCNGIQKANRIYKYCNYVPNEIFTEYYLRNPN